MDRRRRERQLTMPPRAPIRERPRQIPMSAREAIRGRCLWCCDDQPGEVALCAALACPLHPWRMGGVPERGPSALSAIRATCLDCVGSAAAVERCASGSCVLWLFRGGERRDEAAQTQAPEPHPARPRKG